MCSWLKRPPGTPEPGTYGETIAARCQHQNHRRGASFVSRKAWIIGNESLPSVLRLALQAPFNTFGFVVSEEAQWMQAELTQINIKLERLLDTHGVILEFRGTS